MKIGTHSGIRFHYYFIYRYLLLIGFLSRWRRFENGTKFTAGGKLGLAHVKFFRTGAAIGFSVGSMMRRPWTRSRPRCNGLNRMSRLRSASGEFHTVSRSSSTRILQVKVYKKLFESSLRKLCEAIFLAPEPRRREFS